MKRYFPILGVLLLFSLSTVTLNAQCKGFAKNLCKSKLKPYMHDGNYNAAILTEGEEAELYKTFYAGQSYRLAVCGSSALPNIEYKVIDANHNVLYSNKNDNYDPTWDFKPEASQQLKIRVKVPTKSGKDQKDIKSGCVAIMFGFKTD